MKEKVECFLIWNVSARILSLAFNQKPYLLVKLLFVVYSSALLHSRNQ